MNEIFSKKEGLDKIMKGLDSSADTVGSTMGPKGANIYIDDLYVPRIVNDGATISRHITFKDRLENAGAYVIKNVSGQQNDDVGDGTTTVVVLTQAIIHEALKRPENAMTIKESLKTAGDKILKILSKKSTKIDKGDVERVALISAENKDLAKMIAEIIDKLGEKAVINVEDSKTFGTSYEIVDGFEIPFGYMAPYAPFGKITYDNVPVLVVEGKINNPWEIDGVVNKLAEQKMRSCVIACGDIEDATLGVLGISKVKGLFDTVVVRMNPEELQNIAGATGAKMVSPNTGLTFQNITVEDLGRARKIVCDANKTLVMSDKKVALTYSKQIEEMAENEPNMYLKKKIEDRAAKVKGGVAVLKIGAPTDLDREYLKLKAEDAVKAVHAALEEGVVEGGGMTLWRIAQDITPKTIGEEILKKALIAPLKKIIENAGQDYSEVILGLGDAEKQAKEMNRGEEELLGYDARNDCYTNMLKCGIIDPSKVERCAIENAVSSASIFITTNAVITLTDEPK